MGRKSLTLAIEPELLLEARKTALERRTTVNQLVREFLASLVAQPTRRKTARQRLAAMMDRGIVDLGPRTWTREDLHER
jgi:hypothetical protein